MSSYLLRNGKSGNIDDPAALRAFYTILYYYGQTKTKTHREAWRRPPTQRSSTQG
jgi:hypothetical protein